MNVDDVATFTALDGKLTGAEILGQVHAALTRYVVFPDTQSADAVTLWIAATHAQPAWEHATRLGITAPEKRCGKSRLLDIIEATCHAPLITVNISPAALVRSIGDEPPTLLVDEADTIFGRKAADNHEDLRGIINAGHQRNRPYIRWDATTRTREKCPTFAMAALAGIGNLPDTITDRAVVIKMRRRAPSETVKPYRTRRDAPALRVLRDQLSTWATERLDQLTDAEPDMPVDDRAADNWEPLIAMADAAGESWPDRARAACRFLTGNIGTDTSIGIRLLSDLRSVFGDAHAMYTETVLAGLCKLEEAPWADWHGRNLSPRDLAGLLEPYSVGSTDVKIDGKTKKGYRRDHLYDVWNRYLPGEARSSATSATSATGQVSDAPVVAGRVLDPQPATGDPSLTCKVAQVAEVADPPGQSDDEASALTLIRDVLGGEVIATEWPEGTIGADANPAT